jgi:predicted AlkP superfamily phosphohydrolase/phosphomutase
LPTLQSLIFNGVSGSLRSVIPTHSYAAWASFMTGKNPGKHAVYAFESYATQDGNTEVVDRRSISGETLFEVLSRHGRKVNVAHIPLTFPPKSVNGVWISGMIIPNGAGYTHPESLQMQLESRFGDLPIRDISWNLYRDDWTDLFNLADEIASAQTSELFYLMEQFDWQVLTYIFVSPDRLQHPSMRLVDESHPNYDSKIAKLYSPRLRAHYELLDDTLKGVLSRIDDDTLLLLVSDHGFRSCWQVWSANAWLREKGFLKKKRDWNRFRKLLGIPLSFLVQNRGQRQVLKRRGKSLLKDEIDWSSTIAYAGSVSEQGIRINLKNREPYGIVPETKYLIVRERIRTELEKLRDPKTGQSLLKQVYYREDLFQGKYLDQSPDIIFDFESGVTGFGGHNQLMPSGWRSGDHGLDGILVAYGRSVVSAKKLMGGKLIDIAPTVLHFLDEPVPEDMDGQFLSEMFVDGVFGAVEYEKSHENEKEQVEYSGEEQRQIEERLRNLGYL